MSATRIKFCGIARAHDLEEAISLGAWAVGMILWPGSPRAVSVAQAAELAALAKRRVESVGVFVNATLEEITATVDQTGLTIVQLHGDEGPAFAAEVARRTGCKVIKAVRVRGGEDIQDVIRFHTDFHLLDSYTKGVPGGTGETWNWGLVRAHDRLAPPKNKGQKVPVILSGGLTPLNVGEAIKAASPWAVDICSGVESAPGYKDHEKMRALAAEVLASAPPPAIVVDGAQTAAGGDPLLPPSQDENETRSYPAAQADHPSATGLSDEQVSPQASEPAPRAAARGSL